MDKSMDSIGSCSLDVDGVSTDFSDTSSSLNLLTPSSAKDFTREFTSGIHERCRVPVTFINSNKSISTVKTTTTISQLDPNSGKVSTIVCPSAEVNAVKKPSYINLACCVNGYSNLTTYDSKLRQDINRSREVSPIRPITQYFYNRSSGYSQQLSVPFLTVPQSKFSQAGCTMDTQSQLHAFKDNIVNNENQIKITNCNGSSDATIDNCEKRKSFIQQRVERLYGKDSAMAQGFLAKRKSTENSSNGFLNGDEKIYNTKTADAHDHDAIPYNEELLKPNHKNTKLKNVDNTNQDEVDNASLPVLRHLKLNSEFRKQLQLISPKKSVLKNSTNGVQTDNEHIIKLIPPQLNSVDNSVIACDQVEVIADVASNSENTNKDGHYFLRVMNNEKDRLLELASKAENDLEFLLSQDNEELEDVIGYVRAATGKAKLLCAKKMNQFKGLCENNICRSPDAPFETKPEDLQGFWDMVMIQVEHVDSLFQEIELIKANDWKKPKPKSPTLPQGAKMTRKPIHSKTTDQSQSVQKKSTTSILLTQKREAQRKHFAELKRKNKLANNNVPEQQTAVEFFVVDKS